MMKKRLFRTLTVAILSFVLAGSMGGSTVIYAAEADAPAVSVIDLLEEDIIAATQETATEASEIPISLANDFIEVGEPEDPASESVSRETGEPEELVLKNETQEKEITDGTDEADGEDINALPGSFGESLAASGASYDESTQTITLLTGEVFDTTYQDVDGYYFSGYALKPNILTTKVKRCDGYSEAISVAKKPGKAQVVGVYKPGKGVKGKTQKVSIERWFCVTKPVAKNPTIIINSLNDTYNMKDNLGWYDDNTTNYSSITWKSSNSKVAAVNESTGDVTFLKTGTAKITGTMTGTQLAGAGQATFTTTFKVAVPKLSKDYVYMKPGGTAKITLKNGANVSWEAGEDLSIVSVSGKNNETITLKADSKCLSWVEASVSTKSGNNDWFVAYIAADDGKYDDTATINGETITCKEDFIGELKMMEIINRHRAKQRLELFDCFSVAEVTDGLRQRALELAGGNPRGTYVYSTPYGRPVFEMDSYQSSPSSAFSFFLKKDSNAPIVFNGNDYTDIDCVIIKTSKKVDVHVNDRDYKFDTFMVTGIYNY